jgi:hypothetical protein
MISCDVLHEIGTGLQVALANKVNIPTKNGLPGKKWVKLFKERMGTFKQATSTSTQRTAGVRLFAGTTDARKAHFAAINKVLQDHNVTTILNYDETQVSGYNVTERMKSRNLKQYTTGTSS